MLYDKTPHPYAHFTHLPWAHEPWKAIYTFSRLFTTLLLVPCWTLYYGLLPRRFRPRPSWSLKQVIYVKFTRRIYKVTEVAGVTFGTRDPDSEPERPLKETRFEWAEPLPAELQRGAIKDIMYQVPCKRVGMFVWPKSEPKFEGSAPIIGLFMHGGGYCHMSATEGARTSNIPRRLMKDGQFVEIYSVEYRLLQHAPWPAVLIDAATAYTHVSNMYPLAKIVLIGDSSGGNLVLALTRWIRDQNKLAMPTGLLLLSPSCDASHAFPDVPSSYVARPNADTDYLTDTPEPRALLQRTFLGFKHRPNTIGSNVIHPEGHDQMDRYLNIFLKMRGRGGMLRTDTGSSIFTGSSASFGTSDETKQDVPAEIQEESRRLKDIVHSEYVSPASPKVLTRWGHEVDLYDGSKDGPALTAMIKKLGLAPGTPISELPPSMRPSTNIGLFANFPPAMVVVGDAERLTTEVGNLMRAMVRDGVTVRERWVKDAVHDILMIPPGWWDEKVRAEVWGDIARWVDEL
ncbi:alpha/beta-hydrolase [Cylindrobasidium torrendii FP15055 ss-10]|uniref:Alpha/beta-hydrolase n=1 Tax=Cylindrobasidium torrendii FP15055 ss-10 TaxID=1314674 RepID=A0A0D7BN36_9AGAR|nr:alpha/beta-hydrolase [Cylindrobasidium torrendii FP15055 ss-10]